MKYFKFTVFVCCLLFSAVVFAGCGCNVEQPVVSIDGCYAVWSPVSNASGYEVVIDDNNHFNTTDTSINLITYLQKGNINDLKVRALGKGFFHFNSDYSESVSVTVAETKLPTPTNFNIASANKSYKATWNVVNINSEDEVKYCLRFVDENNKAFFFQTKHNYFDINGNLSGYGRFTVQVFAYIEDVKTLAPSEFSEAKEFEYLTLTNTVQGVALNNTTLSWNNVSGIDSYNVSMLGGGTQTVDADNQSETNRTSFDISSLIPNGKICAFFGVQAVSSSAEYSSPYSDFYMWYKNGVTKAELNNCKYSYAGTEFDFCADDFDELETIIHFALFYRIENEFMFTVADNYTPKYGAVISTNGDCDLNAAIHTYAEIMDIGYQYSSKTNGFVKYILDIDFKHPEYPRKLTEADGSYSQFTPKDENGHAWQLPNVSKVTAQSQYYRGENFDNFPVNGRAEEVMVYSSDQLYFVLDKGCKPKFSSGTCPAKLVYDAAKNILRQIIDNSMTDYQKTLAIFEWLCYNVKYDINLYNLANQHNVNNIHNYRGFYIEGVLFDNGKAVCDGIAKTFSLMCGLENIECYKAVGLVEEGGSHAWNKVCIRVPGGSAKQWYAVDATWSDGKFESNKGVEYFSHRYFLKTDEEMSDHHEALTNEYFNYLRSKGKTIPQYDLDRKDKGVHLATTTFDYYAATKYNGSDSCYVTTTNKLNSLKSYVRSQDLSYFEFKSNVSSNITNPYILNGYDYKILSSSGDDYIIAYIKKR